jgi:YVTN family beta-propeller protein
VSIQTLEGDLMKTATVFCCVVCIISSIFITVALHAGQQLDRPLSIKGPSPGVLRVTSTGGSGPRLVIYWDAGLTERTGCLSFGDTVTAYVAAENLPGPLERIEYGLSNYAAFMLTYVSDTIVAGSATGDFNSGIEIDFSPAADASGQLLLQTIRFAVTDSCSYGCSGDEYSGINTDRHPTLGSGSDASAYVSGVGDIVVYCHSTKTCDDDGLPDLEVVSFTSPDTAMIYEDISSKLSLAVRNGGTDDNIGNYNIDLSLVADTTTTTGTSLLTIHSIDVPAPGEIAVIPIDLARIPLDQSIGSKYLCLRLDITHNIDELNEADNYIWHPILIEPDPTIDTTFVYLEDFQEGDGGWTPVDINQPETHWQQEIYDDAGTSRDVLWCGTDDPSYATPPGYGNDWTEGIVKQFTLPSGPLTLSYMIQYDTEMDFDYVHVRISTDGDDFSDLETLNGSSGGFFQRDVDISAYAGQHVWISFYFTSDGGWSDEDGMYPTNGAMRIDWVSVTGFAGDDFVSGFDGWEIYAPGSPGGAFRLEYAPPCVMAAPCDLNETTGDPQVVCNAWVAYDPATGLFPEGGSEYVWIAIESPVIPVPQDAIDVVLKFDIYAYLPYGTDVYSQWQVAFPPNWTWTGPGTVFYGESGWLTLSYSMSQYIPESSTEMKIRLVGREVPLLGGLIPHTPAPYFDNVSVFGVRTSSDGVDVSSFPRDCSWSDGDWDGVGDLTDACLSEDSAPFDRDGDGCLDGTFGSRHIEYLSVDTLLYCIHSDGAPHIGDGSDFTAVINAFDAWNAVGGTDIMALYAGTVAEPRARALDGVNTVTFSDPEFDFPMGVLAVGISTSFVEPDRYREQPVRPGQIVDADIIFNPNMKFGTPTAGSGTDIQSVATHEAGHLFGISHSAVRTSTMFFVLPPGTEASTLEAEDRTVFRKAYANAAVMATASRLKGTVTDGRTGGPVPGAIVFAIDSSSGDTLCSEYTMEDGTFDFFSLPDGDYYVAIHPLDGSSRIGYLQAANVNQYIRDIYVDLFVPEYYDAAESNSDDETAMTAVTVTSGSTVNIGLITNIDETGPIVVETSPAPGEEGVKIDASILISFSEPIDVATLRGNFSLRDTVSGEGIGGNAVTLDDDSTLAFIPSDNLDFETIYELRLDTGLSDKYGNGLASPYSVIFTTEAKPDVGITSIMPRKGIETAVIVISGYGFETETAGNTVHFNGADAAIIDASATRLVVEVPEGTVTGNVTVENLAEGKTSNALTFTLLPVEEVARGYDAGLAPLGSPPRAMAVSPEGSVIFVATESGYTAAIADPGSADFLLTRAFPVEGGLCGIDVTPDGKRTYAVSRETGILYRINGEMGAGGLDDLQILNEIPTGTAPLGLVIDPSGRRACVATADNDVDLYDVDPSSATFDMQVGRIDDVGVSLRGCMAFDPSGDLLLVPTGDGKISVCDTRGDTLVASIGVGLDPRDVTVDPTGARAYVTDGNGVAAVVSLDMLEKVAEVPTGGSLRGDAVTPAGSFLFSVNRELNLYDIIDLRQTSQTFRSVIANIHLPVNPVDVELSPDGQYAFSICEKEMALAVTAIGVGPTIHTVSPPAGPEGTKVVIAGKGFGADSMLTVSFNGISVEPDFRSENVLVAAVPAGEVTGPVTVIGTNPSRPAAVSNELYFEGLSGVPGNGFRLAGRTATPGLSGGACILTYSGDMSLAVVESGPGISLCAFDTDPSSDTYMQALGTADMPAGVSIDEFAVLPAGDLALAIGRGAGKAGETDHIPIIDVGRYSEGFLTLAGGLDVSIMALGVSGACVDPAGALLVVAEYGDPGGTADATIHVFGSDLPGDDVFAPITSVSAAGTPVEHPAFHPAGLHCYLPVADPAAPRIAVLDADPESPGYLAINAVMPLPGSPAGPVPVSISFTPDGRRCIVLTCDEGGTEQRDVVMIDTSDPASPSVVHVEPLGGGGAGACHLDVSPLGTRAVVSIEGEGLYHLELDTAEDSIISVGRLETSVSIPSGDYSVDGSMYYMTIPESDEFTVYDFSRAQALAIVSGNGQTGIAGSLLPAWLRVRVAAPEGGGVEGVPVRFSSGAGNGYFYGNGDTVMTVTTDDDGRAGVRWVLGPGTGTQNVSALAPGLTGSPAVFSAEAIADPETLPLRFVEAVPLDSTTGVSATSAARITFSRAVDPASVDTTVCYMIKKDTPSPVPSLIGFSNGNRRVSITPRIPLAPLTEYSLVVGGSILDLAGGPLQNPGSAVFTTTDPPPLRINAISPPSSITGMKVIISGQGFDRDPSDNVVYFNDRTAGVTNASDDHLAVVVPYDSENGSATVRVVTGGQTSNLLTFRVLAEDVGTLDDDVLQKVGTGSATRSVVVTPDGALMYAVSPTANSVVVIDITSLQPFASIPVGENPFAIALNPEGTRAYVTNFLDHTVSVINTGRYSVAFNTVEETIEVGLNPIDALVTPDGDRLVVSNLGSMDLSVVDADRTSETYNMVLATVGTGQTTRTMTVTPDGGLLYIGTNNGYLVVSVVDFGVVKNVGTGSTTKAVTVTPDGALLVVLTTQGEVLFIDIAEGSPTEDHVVGRVGTGNAVKSVTVTPDGGLLYLVLEAVDAILAVDLDRLTSAGAVSDAHSPLELVQATVIDTVFAGEDPAEIAFAPGGADIAVITNAGDNSVSIYNPGGMPIGIAVSGFEVRQSRDAALLEWRTNFEEGVSGFHVLRSDHAAFGYGRVTTEPLVAHGIPSSYDCKDGTVHSGQTYYYKLEVLAEPGRTEEFGPVEFVYTPRFALYQNVPNPFNPETSIQFVIPEAGHVDLRIYDVAGRLVRTLVDGKLAADRHEVTWDGTNNGGKHVASGVYFYRIKAGKHEKTNKMVLLR